MPIILSNNELPEEIICDPDFYQYGLRYNWKVRLRKDGITRYAVRFMSGPRLWVGMHVEVWERRNHKRLPAGYTVDHINGNGLDNRYENLRLATVTQNNANRRVFKSSSTGLKGVNVRDDGKFVARLTVNGRRVFLGAFETAEDAAQAYDNAAKANFGEFAYTNRDAKTEEEQ